MRRGPAAVLVILALSACVGGVIPLSTSSTLPDSPPSSGGSDAPLTTISGASWIRLSTMDPALSESPAVTVDGQIYVFGGLLDAQSGFEASDRILRYDPPADEWSEVGRLAEAVHHAMTASSDGLIYVIGGLHAFRWTPISDVWVFDPTTGELAGRTPLPFAVGAGAAVELDGYIYVVGGVSWGVTLLRYDPQSDTWTELASMEKPREHLAAVASGGLIYALGGRFGLGAHSTVEIYDPDTDSWSEGPDMSMPRAGFAAAVLDGTIYVTGGEDLDLLRAFSSGEALEPGANTWTAVAEMPVGLHGHGMAAVDGHIFVIGGSRRAGDARNSGDTLKLSP